MTNLKITGLDWQILEYLSENSRTSISDIAKQLNRSRSSISEHIERLQSNGILKRQTIELDLEALGFGVSAFVRIGARSSDHQTITDQLLQYPEVVECYILAGAELVMVKLIARDMKHLSNFVKGLTPFGTTQTDIIFNTLKSAPTINKTLRQLIDAK